MICAPFLVYSSMMQNEIIKGPIGVFDSGYGGLTILKEMQRVLPEQAFVYLGDNARAPYGTRSFDVVYDFTLQAVRKLFAMGCPLIILACNTASAKALRTIQQHDLPRLAPSNRVLGVIRPTAEYVAQQSTAGHVGVFATAGTIASQSYPIELKKLNPSLQVVGQACPMWVPLIENGEVDSPAVSYYIQKYVSELLRQDTAIDTVILGCTHYPLLQQRIEQALGERVQVVAQGKIVADRLVDYLKRHPKMADRLLQTGQTRYYTTEHPGRFADLASVFLGHEIAAEHQAL